MGVLQLGGGAKMWGGATWWSVTMSHFSTRGTMMNAVGTNSISTSIPELWGHEFLAVRPNCEKWGTCRQTKTRRRDINKALKLGKKKPPDFEKIYLKFSPLKFRSLYPFGKILVFRVQRCVSGNQWCHTIKKGRHWPSMTCYSLKKWGLNLRLNLSCC